MSLDKHTGRAAQAADLVINHGMSRRAAAKQCGVDPAAVTRLLNKYAVTTVCPCCGHTNKTYQGDEGDVIAGEIISKARAAIASVKESK